MISADANMLALTMSGCKSVGEKYEGQRFRKSNISKRLRISKELLASPLIKDPRGLL